MRSSNFVFLCLIGLCVVGCAKEQPEAKTAHQTAEHAGAEAVPGSHEDWCGEHAVPESQCLACSPDLEIERPPEPEVH